MSDLANLSECMVDSDAGAIGRARRLRGKALALAVFFEVAVIAGLLLWPLFTSAVLPPQMIVTPAPPFPGKPNSRPIRQQPQTDPGPRQPLVTDVIHEKGPIVRSHSVETSEPPDFGGVPGATGSSGPMALIPGSGPEIPLHRGSQRSGPLQVSTGVMEAKLVHRVEPTYPRAAIALHLAGTVVLRAVIAKDGSVQQLEVVSGNLLLAQAALAAVHEWRYQPTLLDGQPVEVETEITVSFTMQ
jgi:protein TonB